MSSVLTLEEAAEYLKVSPDELGAELDKEHIPGTKIAGKWRIKKDMLDKLFDSQLSNIELPMFTKKVMQGR